MGFRKKDRLVYTTLLVACIVLFWGIEHFVINRDKVKDIPVAEAFIPNYILPAGSANDIITHSYYTLSYQEADEQAEWVAYPLLRTQLTDDDRRRPFFVEDPEVTTFSADWRNYKNSGYDRGHLCPAGDRRFSEEAYNETFFTSNISPMRPDFNAGIWNRLEIQVRKWAGKYDTVYVITGGVLTKGLPSIGYEAVSVPEAFYKIVVRGGRESLETIAFLIPHRETKRNLEDFRVTVDELETETGIDFFRQLEDEEEVRIEKDKDSRWPY